MHHVLNLPLILLVVMLTSVIRPVQGASGDSPGLDEINQLANAGAIELATRLLEEQQAQYRSQPAEWMRWEKQRLRFYAQKKAWKNIVQRSDTLPDFVSADFIQWMLTRRAEALIEMSAGEQARQTLRTLIWQSLPEQTTPEQFHHWRRMVIKSYLVDNLAEDAQIASIRLSQDYEADEHDTLLQVRIAILNDRTNDAISILKPRAQEPEAASLLLLAQLRGQHRSAKHVLQAALRYLRDPKIDVELKANLWAVAAEAAQQSGKRGTAANAMEHVIVNSNHVSLPKSIIALGHERLWNAYIDYALYISNQEQLLVGQDKAWMDVAERIKQKRPVGARALYAFVMLRGQTDKAKETAAKHFVTLINGRRHGKQLLESLFAPSHYFKQVDAIPEPIRHALVDIALAKSDIDRASEIMATIKKPPQGSDQFMWRLRRARILVLGNQAEVGAQAVHAILKDNRQLEQAQIDRLLQVVFDLQTAGKNDLAYDLFAETIAYTKDEKVQRELYYWMADSRKAQERYTEAARLYLKSAAHPDPGNMDPWAQTARYHAAESLARAGLYTDAEAIFAHLLRVTDDPTRQAKLKGELQKLWAMQ